MKKGKTCRKTWLLSLWNLKFADKTTESAFFEEKSAYQKEASKFYLPFLLLLSVLLWVSNQDPLKPKEIILNLLKIFILLLHLWVLKKHPQKIEYSLLCIMIPFSVIMIENLSSGMEITEKRLVTYISGAYNQFSCLSGLLLRVDWRKNLVMLISINIFISFRCFSKEEMQIVHGMSPLNVALVNIILISAFSFVLEKKDRKRFFEIKNKEKSLGFFQDFIKNSLPLGVLVFSKKEVSFHNNEVNRLLKLQNNQLGIKDLKALKIDKEYKTQIGSPSPRSPNSRSPKSRTPQVFSPRVRSPRARSPKARAQKSGSPKANSPMAFSWSSARSSGIHRRSLFDLLLDIEVRGLRGTKEISCSLESEGAHNEGKRYLSIRIDRIIWKEEFSTIVVFWENKSAIKIEYLREFEVYKDRVLASLSHQFRTPLNGIMGIFNNVLETTQDNKTRERCH